MVVVPTVMYDKMRALKSIPLFRCHAHRCQCGEYEYNRGYEDNVEFLTCRQCAFPLLEFGIRSSECGIE